MKNEFVPYDIALTLKELGFDEECLFTIDWTNDKDAVSKVPFEPNHWINGNEAEFDYDYPTIKEDFKDCYSVTINVPLYQQAFRWFEEKHLIPSHIKSSYHKWEKRVTHRYSHGDNKPIEVNAFVNYWECIIDYDSKKEAQEACLRKLIEIVNQNKDE